MKSTVKLAFSFSLVVFTAAALFVSCGFSSVGSGVLLWSMDETLVPSGTQVTVRKESKLTGTYTIAVPGLRERIDLPMWRITVFKSKKEAAAFAENYAPYAAMFAVTGRDGLPMRLEPKQDAARVYRLRESQTVKILDRTKEKSTEGIYTDYWYKLLTDDGAHGWAFGYTLTLREGDREIESGKPAIEDEALVYFLSRTWRPEYYRTLIDDGTIDLERFNPEYGLFNEVETNTVRLVTRRQNLSFQYSGIQRAVGSMYFFDGTSLQVTLVTKDRISLQYVDKERTVSAVYVSIDEDLEEIIKKERERRETLFKQILERGNEFVSSAFGTVTINDNGEFTWTNYNLLVPDIIPAGAADKGSVRLEVLLPKDLQSAYTGALSFAFGGTKAPVHFLYNLSPEGFRLVSLPGNMVDDNIVKQAPAFPIVVVFTGVR